MHERKDLQVRKFDQRLLDALVATPKNGAANRGRFRVLSAVRQARLRISDPLVHFRLGQSVLLLPLSHELPLYRRSLPQYALNLGRAVAIVQAKYGDLRMIDVGANVGDSAAIVHAHAEVPILCVEGEDRFFQLLQANTRDSGGIELEHAFVGSNEDRVRAVHVALGTAHVELGAVGVAMRTLKEVVSRHPRFARSKFLKLDAEGFDCKIISSESQMLAQNKPVLFFEYHLPLCAVAGYDPFPVFQQLSRIGYSVVMIYENTGRYLLSVELSQSPVLKNVHQHFAKIGGYCDVMAFHEEDLDLAEVARKSELQGHTHPPISMRSINVESLAHAD